MNAIRVLLVEDNPGDARLVRVALSDAPGGEFRLTHVDRLSDAAAVLGAGAFEAVLLDLSLPDSQGLETLHAIRDAAPDIPVVVLSGLHDEYLALEAVKAGAQDYLVKGQGDGHVMVRAIRYAAERQRSHVALQRSEHMLAESQRIAHVGTWIWDLAAGALVWSDEVYRIFGLEPGSIEPSYDHFLERVHPHDRDGVIEAVNRALRGVDEYRVEHRILRPDGSLRTVHQRAEIERDGAGGPRRMIGAIHDVTESKEVEQALRRARDQLEQRVAERTAHLADANRRLQEEVAQRHRAEGLLRRERDFQSAVFETVGALLVVLDPGGRIVGFNRACEKTTGYTLDEVRGQVAWELFVPPEQVEHVRSVFTDLAERQIPIEHENDWLTRDGERRTIAWSNAVLRGAHGLVEYVIATGLDITERRQLEEKARQRVMELAHVGRLSAMGEMASELAHELNQPLTAIASLADTCRRMLTRAGPAHGDTLDALEEIAAQALRAGEVIRRLRSFARKDTPQRAPLDLNELAQEMVHLTAAEARWNDVRIRLELDTALPPVHGDRILIEQVILNLLRNAVEAMHECPDRLLTIRSRVDHDTVEMRVIDTGPTLAPGALADVFEPFFTTKPDGMGMGLAISHSIVEAHQGRLWARPNPEGGATFAFSLPLAEASERVAEA